MRKREWLLAGLLIVLGIHCFVMPGFILTGTINVHAYAAQIVHICLWIGAPIILTGLIYMFWKKRKDNKGEQL